MRLVHVLSSVSWSGVERYALDICRHYQQSGHDVCVLTRDARAVDDVFRHHGIPLRFAPFDGFLSWGAVKEILHIIRASDTPVTIHTHDTRDAFTALLARRMSRRHDVRIVLTRHHVLRAGRSPLSHWVYRNVDAMIFVSETVRRKFFARWQRMGYTPFDKNKAIVLHNSLNIEPSPIAPEPEKGPVTATYLGRLAPGKGLEYLIDAMTMMGKVKLRLRLVGSGHPDYVDRLRQRAVTGGVMQMIDWPRHKDNTSDFIRNSHFGVLPSDVPEAFGMANIEYMAEGRPQICTRNGAQPEYITDGREGILVAPRNATVLAEQMKRLAVSPELRQRLGQAARERFESELAWPHFISRLEAIYSPRE